MSTANATNGQCDEGAVANLVGGRNGMAGFQILTAAKAGKARQKSAMFGHSLAVGNVDGDGYQHLYAGARDYKYPDGRVGFSSVLFGSSRGPGGTRRFAWPNPYAQATTGFVSGALLDVDGDRRAELIVCSENEADGGSRYGVMYVAKLSVSGGTTQVVAQERITGPKIGQYHGPWAPLAR